ncbi:hypothetical protein BVC80_897g20 [Macleaya cordata]|uniref:Uncharacterized protein n=1 Tax=Macleaya cordata TaxID=56857 RepID=A0A200QFV5_MACCD|nr:hypothetical protein BVC80_897g20 [Macleaya cordata]
MEWWNKMILPMKRVWMIVAIRLGIRKNGLLKLRHDVRTCEYEDVHVMWEMLKRSETENYQRSSTSTPTSNSSSSRTPRKTKRPLWKIFICASRGPHLCGSF